jgi:hypothetical protein
MSISSTTNGMAEIFGGGAPSLRRLYDSTRMPPASTYSSAITPSAEMLSSLPWP